MEQKPLKTYLHLPVGPGELQQDCLVQMKGPLPLQQHLLKGIKNLSYYHMLRFKDFYMKKKTFDCCGDPEFWNNLFFAIILLWDPQLTSFADAKEHRQGKY